MTSPICKVFNAFKDYGDRRKLIDAYSSADLSVSDVPALIDRWCSKNKAPNKSNKLYSGTIIYKILLRITELRRENYADRDRSYIQEAKDLISALENYCIPITWDDTGRTDLSEEEFCDILTSISDEIYIFLENNGSSLRTKPLVTFDKPLSSEPETPPPPPPDNPKISHQNEYILRETSDCPVGFPPWVDHSKERNSDYFGRLDIKRLITGKSQDIKIPYIEVLGDARREFKAYVEGNDEGTTLFVEHIDWTVDLKNKIPDYATKLECEMKKAKESGQERNHPVGRPPILCLNSLRCEDSSLHVPTEKVHLSFGEASYFDHRLYREVLANLSNEDANAFKGALQLFREQRHNELQGPLWSNCGGGIWIKTNDDYLVISHRDPKKVLDVPNTISYSASGSYDRYFRDNGTKLESVSAREENCVDGTPGLNMKKITCEEIGIPFKDIPLNELKLVSLGVDIDRFLIQFSYYWECPYEATDILDYRFQDATSRKEQTLYLIPFTEEFINYLLQNYKFEPGAAFSLMRIRQKYL